MLSSKISDVEGILETCIKKGVEERTDIKRIVPYLWGPPGIGKSSIVHQFAKKNGFKMIDMRLVQKEPTEIRGCLYIDNGQAKWAISEDLPREDEYTIIFLDELNLAPKITQKAAYQLILDRRLGTYELPSKVFLVAAGNRETDGCSVEKMTSALCNRFMHILNIEPNLEEWILNYAIPNNLEHLVVSFLKWKPSLFYKFDKNAKAFPTPRSWESVSTIMKLEPPHHLLLPQVAGLVGEGEAGEFEAYHRLYMECPQPDEIIANPGKAKIPEKADALYAVVTALAYKATHENFKHIKTYYDRLPNQEYAVSGCKDAHAKDNTLAQVPEFRQWVEEHQHIMGIKKEEKKSGSRSKSNNKS